MRAFYLKLMVQVAVDALQELAVQSVDLELLLLSKHQENLVLGSLLPREFDFFSYEGSLTTPPCTEGVRFFILKSTVNVSAAQVAQFPFDANARPVQSRNGREIITN